MDLRIAQGWSRWFNAGLLTVTAAIFVAFTVLAVRVSHSGSGWFFVVPAALAAVAAEGQLRASVRLRDSVVRKAWLGYERTFDLRGTAQLRLARAGGVILIVADSAGTTMRVPLMGGRARTSLRAVSLQALRTALADSAPGVSGDVVRALDLQLAAMPPGDRDGQTPFGRWSTYGHSQPDFLRYLATETS